jgi:eukaryotic-like serine/threonine-protein kinase
MPVECPRCHSENNDSSRFCSHCAAPLGPAGAAEVSATRTLETPVRIMKPGSLVAGKYKIVEEIGQGGMGVVYTAEDLKLKRLVALKFLPPHLMATPELRERFLIEAQAAAALSHPNICIIHEVGESEGQSYIAMEYVEGETLKDKLRKGPMAPREALTLASQVAAGLAEAHHKGIIHRDIKSANIMVTAKGQAKVMDFGLAKLRGGSSLTRSQTTLGTVAYMSPEQARGGDLDQRTDIWSLGVVLYEMTAAKMPFRGDHDQAIIYSILHDEPESLKKTRPDTAPELEQVVGHALAKKCADRYQTMEEFCEDLEAVAEGLKPPKTKRTARRRLFGLTLTGLLRAAMAVILILFGLNVGGFRDRIFGGKGTAEPAIRLAVLPLRNLTGDPGQEYVSDGITEEMIAQLGRLHPKGLGVVGRTSVMRYKKGETPIDQIGRELGVNYVLEGSLRREASRLRITAELIRVTDQTQIWTETYEPEPSGILTVQNQVAQGVAKALAVKLLPAEQARLASVRTVNPEAHDAYLKGSSLWKSLKRADLDAAQRSFELALAKDPSYVPAYEGLTWVWLVRQQAGYTPSSEAGPKAKAAALQAIALDDNSAEAHEALASVKTWSDWDWAGAEPEWRRALDLNPNGANAHAYYAHFLAQRGRAAEAIRHSDRALELDPFNALYHSMRGMVLLYLRRYDDAMAAARTAISIRPDLGNAYNVMQRVYIVKGMREEQLADQRLRISGDPERVTAFDRGLEKGGYEGAQRGIAEVLAARYEKSQYHDGPGVALRYLDAGDKDRAIGWLQKAYDRHDPMLAYLGMPPWDRLRDDPRYQALLRRIGLPVGERE